MQAKNIVKTKMYLLILTISYSIVFIGCHKKTSKNQNEVIAIATSKQTSSSMLFQCTDMNEHKSDPFYCLKSACQSVGGFFSDDKQSCECPSQHYFTGWSRPSCVRFSESVDCYFDHEIQNNACVLTATNDGNDISTGAVTIQNLEPSTIDETRLLIPNFENIKWNPPIKYHITFQNVLVGHGILSEKQLETILADKTVIPYDILIGDYIPTKDYIYFSTKQDLELFFENNFDHHLEFQLPETNSDGRLVKINQILKQTEGSKFNISYSSSEKRCLDSCILENKIVIDSQTYATYIVQYIGGALAQRVLRVYLDQSEFPVAAYYWTANKIPSLQIYFSEELKNEQFLRHAKAFDRNGNSVGSISKVIFDYRDLERTKLILNENQKHFRSNIIVCDSPLNPDVFMEGNLLGALQLGPYKSNQFTSGSYLGWFNTKDQSHFSSEIQPLSSMGFPSLNYQGGSEHSSKVINIALAKSENDNTPRFGVIHFELSTCMDKNKFNKFSEHSPNNTRVINLSAARYISAQSCLEFSNPPQADATTPFLWVLAAGNLGFKTEEALNKLCPQSLAGQKNILIVAGLESNRQLHNQSNKGIMYADIAADGNWENRWGTSFAAPRVSRAAAQIAEDLPQLSNEMIRLSILLGADLVPGLEVRSEGVLNEEKARLIAHALAKETSKALEIKVENALSKVYCSSKKTCKIQQTKLGLFKSRMM